MYLHTATFSSVVRDGSRNQLSAACRTQNIRVLMRRPHGRQAKVSNCTRLHAELLRVMKLGKGPYKFPLVISENGLYCKIYCMPCYVQPPKYSNAIYKLLDDNVLLFASDGLCCRSRSLTSPTYYCSTSLHASQDAKVSLSLQGVND